MMSNALPAKWVSYRILHAWTLARVATTPIYQPWNANNASPRVWLACMVVITVLHALLLSYSTITHAWVPALRPTTLTLPLVHACYVLTPARSANHLLHCAYRAWMGTCSIAHVCHRVYRSTTRTMWGWGACRVMQYAQNATHLLLYVCNVWLATNCMIVSV